MRQNSNEAKFDVRALKGTRPVCEANRVPGHPLGRARTAGKSFNFADPGCPSGRVPVRWTGGIVGIEPPLIN